MRRSRRARGDAGKIAVLEAVIVATIMVSAAAFAATLDIPSSASNRNGEYYDQKLDDTIDVMVDTPLPPNTPCDGETVFAQAIDEAIGGSTDRLSGRFERAFGPGIREKAYIEHSNATYPLLDEFDNPSPATRMIRYTPNYTWSKMIVASDTLSGQESLTIDVPALKRHTLVRPFGEAIITTLKVEGNLVTNNVTIASLTAMPGPADSTWKRQFAQNITWASGPTAATDPMLARELASTQLTSPQTFFLKIQPGLSGVDLDQPVLPALLRLKLTLPSGWSLDENALNDANTAWTISVDGDEERGWQLLMSLDAVQSSTITVRIDADPPDSPTRPFDEFHAKLGNGSLGESTLLVSYPASVERGLPRLAYATTPYPVRNGTWALFGVSFANGGDAVAVRQIDVEIPGGYDLTSSGIMNDGLGANLFAAASIDDIDVQDANGGTWTPISAKHWRWEGVKNVDAGSVAFWAYGILITNDLSEQTSTQPIRDDGPVSIIQFENGYAHETRRWGSSPGVFRHTVRPASGLGAGDDGYPWSATGATHSIVGEVVDDKVRIPTKGTYYTGAVSGDAVSMQNGVANSTFSVEEALVPLGSLVRAEADISSLASFVSTIGATSTTFTADLYSPNTYGCKPIMTWTREIETMPLSAIRALEVWDPTGAATPTIYLTGDDARLYKLDQRGSVLWSRDVTGAGMALATGDFGPFDKGLFVGTKGGQLARYEPSTGAIAWSAILPRAAWSTDKAPNGVTDIAVDGTGARVLAATAQGVIELRSASGSLLGRHMTVIPGEAYVQVGIAPNGRMFAVTNTGELDEVTYDARYGLGTVRAPLGGLHFALGTYGIILHDGINTRILDYATLVGKRTPFTHLPIQLAASGNATGDATEDHILALSDLSLVVIDGATGTIAWTYAPPTVAPPATPPVELEPFLPSGEEDVCEGPTSGGYTTPVTCDSRLGTATGTPLALYAGNGRVAYAHKEGGSFQLSVVSDGEALWMKELSAASKPIVLTMGAWGANDAVATGTDAGLLTAHDQAVGLKLLETEPTEFAGKFTFHFPVPRAGLYGTHTLTGALSWEDSRGETYSARVMDAFEVVDTNGVPNTSPRYKIHFLLEDEGDPMLDGEG